MTYALHVLRVLLTPTRHVVSVASFPAMDTARWTEMVETARRVS